MPKQKPAIVMPPGQPSQKALAFIRYIVRPFGKRFALFFVLSGLACVCFTAAPFAVRNLINHLVENGTGDKLVWVYIGVFAALRFVDEWLWRIAEFKVLQFLPYLQESVRTVLFKATLGKNHHFFVNSQSGQIGYWINNAADKVRSVIELTIWSIWVRLFSFALAMGFLMVASWELALLFGAWLAVLMTVIVVRGRTGARLFEVQGDASSEVSGRVVDAMANNLPVRVFDAHEYETTGLKPTQHDYIVKWQRSWRQSWVTNAFKGNSAAFVSSLALGLVVYMYGRGQVGLGDIALFVTYVTSASETIWDLSFQLNQYIQDYGSLRNSLTKLLGAKSERANGADLQTKQLAVEFRNLSFAYPDQAEQLVLNKMSFTIAAGERVGVVGHSGAGKSTLVSLLLGLHEPTDGRLLYNDRNAAELSLASIRRNCGYVPQDTSLFNRTIRQNITYGMSRVSDADLFAAAKRAQAHDFIQKLPKGYDSLVGERGVKLSGGQRQRIAIARAMLSSAPFIILDEATSALDSVSEQHIQKALAEVMKDRTALVIAHRLSTLKHLDRIVVLDQGAVAEQGTHDELIAHAGIYADLWRRQKDGFLGA